ncbi:hypothetical protein M885DRAFT_544986 [Pelagophyceae sp. CCMP2097]|nr:hypothetical protein M885DRAFT_544986 [Pelagophyceae sp. CCMP2097]
MSASSSSFSHWSSPMTAITALDKDSDLSLNEASYILKLRRLTSKEPFLRSPAICAPEAWSLPNSCSAAALFGGPPSLGAPLPSSSKRNLIALCLLRCFNGSFQPSCLPKTCLTAAERSWLKRIFAIAKGIAPEVGAPVNATRMAFSLLFACAIATVVAMCCSSPLK